MLALVNLIHALPTRGRKVPNSCFQGKFASRKIGGNAFVQGELAFMLLGASSFCLNFSHDLLLMVSSPFATP
jgi:hypothetical protein